MRRANCCLQRLSCTVAARAQAAAKVADVKCIRTPDVLALDLQKVRRSRAWCNA